MPYRQNFEKFIYIVYSCFTRISVVICEMLTQHIKSKWSVKNRFGSIFACR